MASIEEDDIFRRIKGAVNCHRQFNNAQVGAEMATSLGDFSD